jgi:tetratricopeptide (TPR) repeat protein
MFRTLQAGVWFPALVVAFIAGFGLPSLIFAQERLAQIYLDSLGEPDDYGDDLEGRGNLPRPDTKKGEVEEEGGPPYSAEERKEDKLNLELGGAPLETIDRPKLLAELYERLRAARSAEAAQPIMTAIEELWRISGSDTVDLLVARAERFIEEEDFDLALKILDAAADIAPEDAEVWHQRAVVHLRKEEPERALADLRRALNIDPKHYRAMYELAGMLEALGAKKEALKTYREALVINPFLDDARRSVDALSREVEGQEL